MQLSNSNIARKQCGLGTGAGALFAVMVTFAVHGAGAQNSGVADTPINVSSGAPAADPQIITLDEAIRRAKENDTAYAGATADARIAGLDRSIARGALLPGVTYHNQYLYTQPNGERNQAGQGVGTQAAPRFIANNAIREYASQGLVNETIGLAQIADLKRAGAEASRASAQQEVSRRTLVAMVVEQYYSLLAADRKLAVAERAADEAQRFSALTGKLEGGREVAHADVVKADLQLQQRQRDLADARLTAEKSRLDLALLLFPNPRTNYKLADQDASVTIPPRADVEGAASRNNPEIRSALEALRAAGEEVNASRAAYLPDLGLNYTYGIDAPQFALYGPTDTAIRPKNLGYSASVTLDIPVWDWFATHNRVKQSEIRQGVAKTELTFVQKRLVAQLDELYNEAATSEQSLASLGKSVETAGESLRLVNLRYQAGEATVLEVIDAQNALTLAESARADGVVRFHLALANLQTLTGTLP